MKIRRFVVCVCILLSAAVLLSYPAPCETGPAEARRIAREAYIALYPLVMSYRLMYTQAIDEKSQSSAGGFGRWIHYTPASPELTDFTSPGTDTLYSCAWVDLRAEPWVLTVPPTAHHRYVASQWNDLWGHVLDNPGVIRDGEAGGSYLLAGPGWEGRKPEGIRRVIRGESAFLGTLTRTEVMSPPDLASAQQVRQGFKLRRLSAFLGRDLPDPAPPVRWPSWKEGSEKTLDFFGYANFMLTFTAPNPRDRAMLEQAALIGIGPGRPWKPETFGRSVQEAIQEGIGDALEEMQKAAKGTTWSNRLYGGRQTGQTLRDRCLGAYLHTFGNEPRQMVYAFLEHDAQGKPLDGSTHAYTLTFPRGGTPLSSFFWSATVYCLPGRTLVPNRIGRYSIGTHSLKLLKGADGSITLYLQRESPGRSREINWLPVPDGPFSLVMRSCGPDREVIFHEWKPPRPVPVR